MRDPARSPNTSRIDKGVTSERLDTSVPGISDNPPETFRPTLYIYPRHEASSDPTLENAVNLEHMELLSHFVQAKDLFSLGGDRTKQREVFTTERILDLGIHYPYLLYQMLAFSARHLASIHSSKTAAYLHHSITLQTRAVSLFNASNDPITRETCVPILLFSTVLGHQVLTDTLCRRDAAHLDTFLVQFVQCLDTLRGVYVIFQEAMPFWQDTVLGQILSISSSLTSRKSVGTRCQRIRELVNSSANLNQEEKEACQAAIRYLQVGFDALFAEDDIEEYKYQMLFLWCILTPKEFIALLSANNTEALLVLGHYAILLDYGRTMWQVKDAGEYILGLVRTELDSRLQWDWECR